ncbi:SIR2 family protein [Sinomonas sp. G460-2]|uniref:SIR2 family protein n=1 Tax=Sinomonas sp. G460-2 TaxID=3393464 RepID=UPI0039F13DCF
MEVIDAHAEGRLVLFVGAGASMNEPSGLPSFEGLARKLADMAGVPFAPSPGIDTFLGELSRKLDVHSRVHELVGRPDSRPNETHRALVELALASHKQRIVTTNFDGHLTAEAAAATAKGGSRSWDIYCGPALPLGDDFTGLVYLHGSISRGPKSLVITDRDFGKSYLTDAWATRFLQRMFDEFVVLFVGYSHTDPVMGYLAMGLPSRTRRYVLTECPRHPRWDRFGVKPIGYPDTQGHPALTEALTEWTLLARMGRTEHQSRMAEIVENGIPRSLIDLDYVLERLKHSEGARDLVAHARGREWLEWLEGRDVFASLFRESGAASGPARELAAWYCLEFAEKPEMQHLALGVMQRLGPALSRELFEMLQMSVARLAGLDQAAARRWQALLATSIPGHTMPSRIDRALASDNTDPAGARTVLRAVLAPYLVLKKSWSWSADDDGTPQIPTADVKWPAEEYLLRLFWDRLKATGEAYSDATRLVVEGALIAAYDMVHAYDGERFYDPFAFRRPAVEAHDQNSGFDVLHFLVDALSETARNRANASLHERWWALEYPLFRRLSVHALGISDDLDANAKIGWLMDRDLFFDAVTKHETYMVLRAAVPNASPETKNGVLERVARGPAERPDASGERKRRWDYGRFNILVWLTEADPEWAEARTALSAIQAEHQDFRPREHPDLDHWMETGTWGGRLPLPADEFVQIALSLGIEPALDRLLSHDYTERRFDEPTWDDALAVVRAACEATPSVGFLLWDSSRLDGIGDQASDIRREVITGWGRADLEGRLVEAVNLAGQLIAVPGGERDIARFLHDQAERESPYIPEAFEAMGKVARELWAARKLDFRDDPTDDPLEWALNSWPGDLAYFWIRAIARRWQADREGWRGLDQNESKSFIQLLEDQCPGNRVVWAAAASELYLLHEADPEFAEAHLFPLFSKPESKPFAWPAFLSRPRLSNRTLERGFLKIVMDSSDLLTQTTQARESLPEQYLGILVLIANFFAISQDQRKALVDLPVLYADDRSGERFAAVLARAAERMDPATGEQVWDLWIKEWMGRRFRGIPRKPQTGELEAIADIIPFLGERIPEALAVFALSPVGFTEHLHFASVHTDILGRFAEALATHFGERLRLTQDAALLVYEVQELWRRLRQFLSVDQLEPLASAAYAAGMPLPTDEREAQPKSASF